MAEERVAIVTGAARGIGLACARRFAADGAKVVLADRDDKAGREAAKELGDEKTALYVHCDVSSRLEVHNLIAETLSAFGRIDVLVNNAGMISTGTILDLEEDAFDKVMGVNLKGAFLVAQAVARQMVKQVEDSDERVRDLRRRHAIINMSSINQTVAIPNQLAYCVSKGGMGQLTKAMALALAPYNIRVNGIGPGSVQTDMLAAVNEDKAVMKKLLSRTPMSRMADADEIAGVAAFLASPDSSYITGQTIYPDGGRLALNYTVPAPGEEE
ncbi:MULTISPECIES: SDR family NAD(P)-dependent oxidoreductase [Euryhalocaulis]|uniref:SDR family NAD(P)-dependent oxidoreductase n=1 Tax=Euryhalocaulis TaxID=1712422 RepID=UPI0003A29F63|nr:MULTISPECIES: SDR family oxidoreductase [Euryhalocaulis]MBA4801433.1 SDR family oxidoreductase [Euryhalocaulis sp.]